MDISVRQEGDDPETDLRLVTVRDSAVIEIVESFAPQWTPESRWHLASNPAAEIGLVEGPAEYLFSNDEPSRGVTPFDEKGRVTIG